MAINTTTARADIFKEFRAVINSNITHDVKVTNSFVNDVAVLPQVVINSPSLGRERNAFGTDTSAFNRDGSIEIELFATQMKTLVELIDEVENIIFTNLSDISVQNLTVGSSTLASLDVGEKMVHTYVIPVSFIFRR